MNRISHFGTIYNLDKLVTLGGIYTELADEGNVLRMSPTDSETEPSTVVVALSKGMKVDGVGFSSKLTVSRFFGIGNYLNTTSDLPLT